MKLGPTNVVFLNDWDSIKEALSKDELLARPEQMLQTGLFRSENNIVTVSGRVWTEQRRFAFKTLREFGLGKQAMESSIRDEISHLVCEIEKRNTGPVNIHELLSASVSNNICKLVFGHRYEYDAPERILMERLLADLPRLVNVINRVGVLPLVKHVVRLFGSKQTKSTIENIRLVEKLIDYEIEKHKENLQEGYTKDYIDVYLKEMNAREKQNNIRSFTVDVIHSNVRVLFNAGSVTVRTTLDWMMKLVSVHQDIQRAVQNEIDSVVASDATISWSDRDLMPLTQAFILETQRWSSVVPFNLPRRASKDTNVAGHLIPKNTAVIANFWAVNRDTKLWNNPFEFNPYRFLSKDGKIKEHSALIPFSYGKRACIGETMARMELFLYFATLMKRFTITVPKSITPSFDCKVGVTLQPIQEPILNFSVRGN